MKLNGGARACLGLAAAGLGAGAIGSAPATGHEPPNIVMIVADDLGYDQTSLFGRSGSIPTPGIEAIGDDGIRATTAYVASPVCSPSRSAMLTGREPSRVGADSNDLTRGLAERMPTATFVDALPSEYRTAAIGKWDLAGTKPFDAAHLPDELGFDEFTGFLPGEHQYCQAKPGTTDLAQYNSATDTYVDVSSSTYLTDEFTQRAVDYVDERATDPSGDPFFLYLAYNAPHVPLQTPTTCAGGQQTDEQRFAEMVQIMDAGIARVRDAIATAGLAENTMVVFVSDNGQQKNFFTGDTRGGKYQLFEGGIRVPFAMSWPARLRSSGVFDQSISTLDLSATILTAAGAPGRALPGGSGVDLIPYFAGDRSGAPHSELSWRYVSDAPTGGEKGSVMVAQRSGDLKWIRSTSPPKTGMPPVTTEYLFDFAQNPVESDEADLSPDPRRSKRLVATHNAWNELNPVQEDFENPRDTDDVRAGLPDGWLDSAGSWSVVGSDQKAYRGTSVGIDGRSMLEASWFDDLTASTTVSLDSAGAGGVIVRGSGAAEAFDGYVAVVSTSPPAGGLCHGDSGGTTIVLAKATGGVEAPVACKHVPVDPAAEHRLEVSAIGATLAVTLDDARVLRWSDRSRPYLGGRVGLRVGASSAGDSTADFADFTATRRR